MLLLTLNMFHSFFQFSIVDFEQVNVSWKEYLKLLKFEYSLSYDKIEFSVIPPQAKKIYTSVTSYIPKNNGSVGRQNIFIHLFIYLFIFY